ncbi:glycosyltransferase family 2 protein [Planktomarina temperata]|nr:glycosyltransferase family 2 protein [Planktomarina temperata]
MRISAIITTFNDTETRLRDSMRSILQQDHKVDQIIVIDDGSSVPFGGIPQRDFPEVLFIQNNENIGVAKSRNKAAHYATGDYISFLDCGDVWLPSKNSIQRNVAQSNPESILIFSSAALTNYNGYFQVIHPKECNDWTHNLLISQPITGSISNTLILKAAFHHVNGFYVETDIPEDRDLWLRLSKIGSFSFTNDITVHIEISENSRSSNLKRTAETYKTFIELHRADYIYYNLLEYATSLMYISLANKAFSGQEFRQGFKFLWQGSSYKTKNRCLRILIVALYALISRKGYRQTKAALRNGT